MGYDRLQKYGIDREIYDSIEEAQGGLCAICRKPESVEGRSLSVDHCHLTGQVRGLLCTRCNQCLGRLDDNVDIIRNMAAYLEESRSRFGDCCPKSVCDVCSTKFRPYAPVAVRMGEKGFCRFGYVCEHGKRWTCGWATGGARGGFKLRPVDKKNWVILDPFPTEASRRPNEETDEGPGQEVQTERLLRNAHNG
jgi:hypothetical protein